MPFEDQLPNAASGRAPLREVAAFFLRLGFTAFGGPAAHIALMEREAVARRGWVKREAFLDFLGAVNLIPGPSSTQLAMSLGFQRAGWAGLLLGGACFILPASLLTLLLAWAYVRFGRIPQVQGLLYGVKPVVLVLVAQALWGLGRTAFKRPTILALGALALLASLLGLHPLTILLGAGIASFTVGWLREHQGRALPLGWMGMAGSWAAGAAPAVSALGLFLFFLKMGIVVFGSGYVLLAFLKADLVDHWHWLSNAQLLDAIAVGQVTPGPVFTTATFIGYLLGGVRGALLATLGIFLPSFLMVGVLARLVPRLRNAKLAGAFLDGVNAGALALMARVGAQLGRAALVDPWTWLLALVGLALLLRTRLNPTWLVLGGALTGGLLSMVVHA